MRVVAEVDSRDPAATRGCGGRERRLVVVAPLATARPWGVPLIATVVVLILLLFARRPSYAIAAAERWRTTGPIGSPIIIAGSSSATAVCAFLILVSSLDDLFTGRLVLVTRGGARRHRARRYKPLTVARSSMIGLSSRWR